MKILILANFGMGLYKFRKELIEELLVRNYKVYISLPNDNEYVPKLIEMGCKFIETNIDRRGTNPINDIKLFLQYKKIIKNIKPNVVLTYTIKPNIYGGLACRISKVPYLPNITGLGSAVENGGALQKFTLFLYKISLKNASCVFFQNKENKQYFIDKNIVVDNYRLIPGSGVNIQKFKFENYPKDDSQINFLFIGRIMKEKGINELLKAAEIVRDTNENVSFNLIGGLEEDFREYIKKLEKHKVINYYGQQNDVRPFIKKAHAIIHPSYHEGMANVLLEASSMGRPVIASSIPGCQEIFDEGVTGFGVEPKNVKSIVDAVNKFISLPHKSKVKMGMLARKKIEKEFDRNKVVTTYVKEIEKAILKE